MALYEFPKLNVLEGVGIDDSPLLHGQNVTGAFATLVMDQAGQPP